MNRRIWLGIVLILLCCFYDGLDRWKTQQLVMKYERQADGIFFKKDLDEWRKNHSLKPYGVKGAEDEQTSQDQRLTAPPQAQK